MVQAENIDSRCSSFQLDDCSRRDHHSLAHLSKYPLSQLLPISVAHDKASVVEFFNRHERAD